MDWTRISGVGMRVEWGWGDLLWGTWTARAAWVGGMGLLLAERWRLARATRLESAERWREWRIREELEAYARVETTLRATGRATGGDLREARRGLAREVCRTIAGKSVFARVALLLRDEEGRLVCVGSVGTDDLTVACLQAWGEGVVRDERQGCAGVRGGAAAAGGAGAWAAAGMGVGAAAAKSFAIPLGEWAAFDPEVASWAGSGRKERRRWRRAMVAPIRASVVHGGVRAQATARLAGAIVVCADGARLDGRGGDGWGAAVARAMGPIETLAGRLAAAMENETLTERLLKTEKLAGLGQLAGGVAHALNNPLTAVLGFAELIAETSSETRVCQDAATILEEAKKMKETVARLVEFWRPVSAEHAAVDVGELVGELAKVCGQTLRARGVRLEVTGCQVTGCEGMPGEPAGPKVRGSRDRLRQVFEHLLNNAAQAIAGARAREEGEEHAIRVTVTEDRSPGGALHVIVSDTGPGFKEPGRIFDPFYTTKGPEQGAGLGLSICYGIVREHGGEISAFNLHPHGAAVVVELPLRGVVEESSAVVREVVQSRA